MTTECSDWSQMGSCTAEQCPSQSLLIEPQTAPVRFTEAGNCPAATEENILIFRKHTLRYLGVRVMMYKTYSQVVQVQEKKKKEDYIHVYTHVYN